jgi:hypothetical protein
MPVNHSVQNLLSSNLLPRNVKIKIYRTIHFLVVLCGCKAWSHALREKQTGSINKWGTEKDTGA